MLKGIVMSRRTSIVCGVSVLLAAHLAVLALVRGRTRWTEHEEAARAAERNSLSQGLRTNAILNNSEAKNDQIGTLTSHRYWTEILSLAEAQASAITKLDVLVTTADTMARYANADYLDLGGAPDSYREYLANGEQRRHDALHHAQRMVAIGLLTSPQAALVIQRVLSGRKLEALYDQNVQELLKMTKSQRAMLAGLAEDTRIKYSRLNAFTLDPHEQKKNAEKGSQIKREYDRAIASVLTPAQRETWSRLAAERPLPAGPPDLRDLSDVNSAIAGLRRRSSVFRFIDQDAGLALSAKQARLLKGLEEITCQGLLWIGQESPDFREKRRAEFTMHAEEVALQGILTQEQEDKVREALAKK